MADVRCDEEMMKRLLIMLCLVIASCAIADKSTNRSPEWATFIPMEGVPNLHKVSDVLYRSAQPTEDGMRQLKALGIKTVINLRSFHSDRDELGQIDLDYEHLYMKAWHPERKEAERFLEIVTDPKRTPVLVHCQHGADRTGTMCAMYRIVVQKWTKEEAIREMTEGGYGFHEVWANLPEWIDKLDIGALRIKTEQEKSTEQGDGD